MQSGANHEQLFEAVFRQEYAGLCNYALSFLQDAHLAEDIVQESFIRTWERRPDIFAGGNARFYLLTAVRNNAVSALRKQSREGLSFGDAENEYAGAEPFISPMIQAEEKDEQMRRLASALDQLPPRCRELFLLIKGSGLSYAKAAETLNISVKTVEAQMGKALRLLRTVTAAVFLALLLLAGGTADSTLADILARLKQPLC